MAQNPESALLKKIRPDHDAEAELKNILVERARSYAACIIDEELVKRVSATEAACSAAHSLVGEIRKGTATPGDSVELYHMLLHRTRCKVINRIRKATAQKRDVGVESADDVQQVLNDESSPVREATLNEMSVRFAQLLCEPAEDIYRCINLLGILSGYNPAEIRKALEVQPWIEPGQCPAVSTIRLWLKAERIRIQDELGIDEE